MSVFKMSSPEPAATCTFFCLTGVVTLMGLDRVTGVSVLRLMPLVVVGTAATCCGETTMVATGCAGAAATGTSCFLALWKIPLRAFAAALLKASMAGPLWAVTRGSLPAADARAWLRTVGAAAAAAAAESSGWLVLLMVGCASAAAAVPALQDGTAMCETGVTPNCRQ
jgi:hypothetical protein